MSSIKLFLLSAICFFLFPALIFGQTKPEQKPEPPRGDTDDVIKFETSLVQTDVMVFDKNGRFVDGLKPEQFQLKSITPSGKYPSLKESDPELFRNYSLASPISQTQLTQLNPMPSGAPSYSSLTICISLPTVWCAHDKRCSNSSTASVIKMSSQSLRRAGKLDFCNSSLQIKTHYVQLLPV